MPPAKPPSTPSAFGAQRAAVVCRARVQQPLRPQAPTTATVVGNVKGERSGHRRQRTKPTTSCWTLAPCPSRCWKAKAWASFRRAWTTQGKPHHARQYSHCQPAQRRAPGLQQPVADGEARATKTTKAARCKGVASNYLCDLKVGDKVQVIGPFGTSFLMPNHPKLQHRDDLHRHRQRAHARHDRVAAALCANPASLKAAS